MFLRNMLRRSIHTEKRLAELGYVLPSVGEPKGNYRPCVQTGNFIYTGIILKCN